MATVSYTRKDIEALVERSLNRAGSPLLRDMPELQRDVKAMAMILMNLLAIGVEIQSIMIEDLYKDGSDTCRSRVPKKH
jgi:hypothetical protein